MASPATRLKREPLTRIAIGEFEAHFYVNSKAAPPIVHFIVCRIGDPEILHWGQAASAEMAEREARASLEERSQAR